jgi:hypothetical protein
MTTARATARQEIRTLLAQIKADWQTAKGEPLLIETDNRNTVNPVTQGTKPFLQVSFLSLDGHQLDLGVDPFSRQEGMLLIAAVVKQGEGTTAVSELLDFVAPYFHLKDLSLLRFRAFVAVRPKSVNEWWHEPAIVEWWYSWK